MAETVLDVLLDAELGALAEKNSNSPRSLKQVFYQVPETGIEKLLVDHYDRMKSRIMGVGVQDSWRQLDEIVNDLNREITDTIQGTLQSE